MSSKKPDNSFSFVFSGIPAHVLSCIADHLRWQQLYFVVGIEIILSKNHPVFDICDELKGKYPKDFKFTGWHPHCRCSVLTILKTEEEMAKDTERLLNGEPITTDSVKRVDDVPNGFKDWISDNTERAKHQSNIPYFIKDNGKFIPKGFIESFGTLKRGGNPSVITDIKEAILKIKDPTFITEDEVKTIISDFAVSNQKLFNGGLSKITITGAKDYDAFMSISRSYFKSNGAYNGKGNTLLISKKDIYISKNEVFNPLHEIKSAIKAIREGRTLTFNEEYSLESIWHEIRHATAVGWKDFRLKTDNLTTVMETVNQFCARRTYGQFVTAIGGKVSNRKAIITGGYGYKQWVDNFGKILKEFNVSTTSAHTYLKDIIITTPSEEVFGTVTDYRLFCQTGHKKTDSRNAVKRSPTV